MSVNLPPQVSSFIADVAALASESIEVWLIGSRANGRVGPESDTDLLIFGSIELLQTIRSHLPQPVHVDCLVVFDGDNYQDPWQEKSGAISKLGWFKIDERLARYSGTKWVPDEESSAEFGADMGVVITREERALRVWP